VALAGGIDIVLIAEVEDAIRAHAERYLGRIYTERELEGSRRRDGSIDARRLAATFAAKEATLKALRVGHDAIPWQSIEVRGGASCLGLTGPAAALARARGIDELQLSSAMTDDYAAAIVLARTSVSGADAQTRR
jgi:holo-[acyl-carrier protein] synthase